jgi:outer membrane protein assembly factor BamB
MKTTSRSRLGVFAVLAVSACAGNYRFDGPEKVLGPQHILSLRWHKKLVHHGILSYRPQEWSMAAVSPSGGLYVGASNGRLIAFGKNGSQRWRVETNGAVSSEPAYDPTTKSVYFGADDGRMYAVNALTGKVRWSYATKGLMKHKPVFHQGMLIFATSENRIYGVDMRSGRWRWQYDREKPEGFTIAGHSGVLVRNGVVYAGFADGILVALKASTGEVIWTRSLAAGKTRFVDVDATPVMDNGHLLAASHAGGVFALSPRNGSVIWSFKQTGVTAIVPSRFGPFVVAAKAGVVALDSKGRERWRQLLPKGVPGRPSVYGPYLLVTGTETGLNVASAATGQLLQYFNPGYGISARAAVGKNTVAVVSNRGHLYVFDVL